MLALGRSGSLSSPDRSDIGNCPMFSSPVFSIADASCPTLASTIAIRPTSCPDSYGCRHTPVDGRATGHDEAGDRNPGAALCADAAEAGLKVVAASGEDHPVQAGLVAKNIYCAPTRWPSPTYPRRGKQRAVGVSPAAAKMGKIG